MFPPELFCVTTFPTGLPSPAQSMGDYGHLCGGVWRRFSVLPTPTIAARVATGTSL
ncbi:Uncharacterized protein APZ42_025205 [Daphnia magna]|uniref:Uncharacterized protein n=1 Tax=Daphnia magna TaxID=35525 RepID=A0A164TCH6_9CRUS|nr:Uncharacterized protein APZ42_025205 [Daphnia magna]